MTLLDRWQAAAYQLAMLPDSGLWVRLIVPGPETIVRLKLLPEGLRKAAYAAAERQADPAAIEAIAAEMLKPNRIEDTVVEFASYEDQLAAMSVKALGEPGEEPPETWEEVSLTADRLSGLPPRDVEALKRIATRQTTPGIVTAIAKRLRGWLTEDEAIAAVNGEADQAVSAWDSFRPVAPGPGAGADGPAVGPTPIDHARGQRSRRRAGAG